MEVWRIAGVIDKGKSPECFIIGSAAGRSIANIRGIVVGTGRKSAIERIASVGNQVIGGRNSGNTRRLVNICSGIVETYHIEQASELKQEWFSGKENVGVTTGASTPYNLINGVVEKIKNEF